MKPTKLRTPWTYPSRSCGALGALVVLAGIFLPWAAIAGDIKGFLEGKRLYSGWNFVEQCTTLWGIGLCSIGALVLLILAIVTLIFTCIRKSTVGIGVMEILITISFIALFSILTPLYHTIFSKAFPSPAAELNETEEKALEQANIDLENLTKVPRFSIAPQYGLYVCIGGGIITLIAGVLLKKDAAAYENLKNAEKEHDRNLEIYKRALGRFSATGPITDPKERALLATLRDFLGVSEEEHRQLARELGVEPETPTAQAKPPTDEEAEEIDEEWLSL